MSKLSSENAVDLLEALGLPVKEYPCRSVDIHFVANEPVTADVTHYIDEPDGDKWATMSKKYRMIHTEDLESEFQVGDIVEFDIFDRIESGYITSLYEEQTGDTTYSVFAPVLSDEFETNGDDLRHHRSVRIENGQSIFKVTFGLHTNSRREIIIGAKMMGLDVDFKGYESVVFYDNEHNPVAQVDIDDIAIFYITKTETTPNVSSFKCSLKTFKPQDEYSPSIEV